MENEKKQIFFEIRQTAKTNQNSYFEKNMKRFRQRRWFYFAISFLLLLRGTSITERQIAVFKTKILSFQINCESFTKMLNILLKYYLDDSWEIYTLS